MKLPSNYAISSSRDETDVKLSARRNRSAMTLNVPFTSSETYPVTVLRGSEAILAQSTLLERLAETCAQSGAMQWLSYFLGAPSVMKKDPYLVLLLHHSTDAARWRPEDVWGAALMFEYVVLGLRTRAFSTDDVTGFRTVIAPLEMRAAAATLAAKAMIECGGQFVFVSYDEGGVSEPEAHLNALLPSERTVRWAKRQRPVQKALPLGETYEETLSSLGKATRFNLRYYRKRLQKKMPLEFVADVRGVMGAIELERLNVGSLNPVSSELFQLRYKSASELPGGYVVGLRGDDGRWLSMVGGWRQGSVTVLHWQMNASGFEKDSLGTVMRSYLLEHEAALGARMLVIYGGTVHSMGNSFVHEEVTDLVVKRRSVGALVLRLLAKVACKLDEMRGRKKNFLARLIAEEELDWHPGQQRVRPRGLVTVGPVK
jgi:hypothetical protein